MFKLRISFGVYQSLGNIHKRQVVGIGIFKDFGSNFELMFLYFFSHLTIFPIRLLFDIILLQNLAASIIKSNLNFAYKISKHKNKSKANLSRFINSSIAFCCYSRCLLTSTSPLEVFLQLTIFLQCRFLIVI